MKYSKTKISKLIASKLVQVLAPGKKSRGGKANRNSPRSKFVNSIRYDILKFAKANLNVEDFNSKIPDIDLYLNTIFTKLDPTGASKKSGRR